MLQSMAVSGGRRAGPGRRRSEWLEARPAWMALSTLRPIPARHRASRCSGRGGGGRRRRGDGQPGQVQAERAVPGPLRRLRKQTGLGHQSRQRRRRGAGPVGDTPATQASLAWRHGNSEWDRDRHGNSEWDRDLLHMVCQCIQHAVFVNELLPKQRFLGNTEGYGLLCKFPCFYVV